MPYVVMNIFVSPTMLLIYFNIFIYIYSYIYTIFIFIIIMAHYFSPLVVMLNLAYYVVDLFHNLNSTFTSIHTVKPDYRTHHFILSP